MLLSWEGILCWGWSSTADLAASSDLRFHTELAGGQKASKAMANNVLKGTFWLEKQPQNMEAKLTEPNWQT